MRLNHSFDNDPYEVVVIRCNKFKGGGAFIRFIPQYMVNGV